MSPAARGALSYNFGIAVALLVSWQVMYLIIGEIAFRPPLQTLLDMLTLLGTPTFWPHLRATGIAFALAFGTAICIGLFVGVVLGAHRFSGEVAEPMIVGLYSLPKLTLYPIILLFFGIGLPAKVAFGALHGIMPIALFTLSAVRSIRPALLKAARVQRLSPWQTVRLVLFPAAFPEIFTGIRIGFSVTLLGTLLGEMFGSQSGLGYRLMSAIGLHHVDIIMAIALLMVICAVGANAGLIAVDRRLRHAT